MLLVSMVKLSTFNRPPSLTIDGRSIKQVECTKSLGVYTDENLSWNTHIDKISKKCLWHWHLQAKWMFLFGLKHYYAFIMHLYNLILIIAVSFWGTAIKLLPLSFTMKNYRIALHEFWLSLLMIPVLKISS